MVKNTGFKPFGNRCKLSFVEGDGLLVSQYHIPNAAPGETVKVSMSFNAFSTPGTYETNFRLSNEGQHFGPVLIVKINVKDPADLMPTPSRHPIQNQGGPPRSSYQQPVAAQAQQQPSYWGQQQQQQRPPQQAQPNYYQQPVVPQQQQPQGYQQPNYYQPPQQPVQQSVQQPIQSKPQVQVQMQVQ